jgi:putative flippase GtrA
MSIQHSFLRFCLTGVVFTILGPLLFWCAYPLGAFAALAIAETSVHALRFFTFRRVVFPANKGYRVTARRYLLSALPVMVTGIVCVAALRNVLGRTALTAVTALVSVLVGFAWSRYVYTRNSGRFFS